MKTIPFLPVFLLATGLAHTQTTPGVIGITSVTPLIVEQDPGTCATTTCSPVGLSARVLPFEGGAAYDATVGGIWASTEGTSLAQYDPDTCAVICPPTTPMGAPWSHITGLATDEATRRLFVSDETNMIYTLDLGCPPVISGGCMAGTPVGHIIGGLAIDDVRRRLFYSTSDFTAPPGFPASNMIFVTSLGDPCNPFCEFAVPPCGPTRLGAITGLGFDACTNELWVTDGDTTVGLSLPAFGAPCSPTLTHCCSLGLGAEEFAGICFKPSRATSFGSSCTSGTCASCPGLTHSTFGDPIVGNMTFTPSVVDAPVGSTAFMLLNFGSCTGGLSVPFLCSTLHVPLGISPITFGPVAVPGVPGACGDVGFPVPIPLDRGACGLSLCTQWLGLCGGSIWLSNALGWTISSS